MTRTREQSEATILEETQSLLLRYVYINDVERGRKGREVEIMSIVGVDQSDFFDYKKKYEAEQIVQQSGLPCSILRATQYHSYAQSIIQSLGADNEGEVKVPAGMRLQSIDSGEVADRLVPS